MSKKSSIVLDDILDVASEMAATADINPDAVLPWLATWSSQLRVAAESLRELGWVWTEIGHIRSAAEELRELASEGEAEPDDIEWFMSSILAEVDSVEQQLAPIIGKETPHA